MIRIAICDDEERWLENAKAQITCYLREKT